MILDITCKPFTSNLNAYDQSKTYKKVLQIMKLLKPCFFMGCLRFTLRCSLSSGAISLLVCSHCVDEKVWILISWLLMKPADQDPHFFQKRVLNFKTVALTVCL